MSIPIISFFTGGGFLDIGFEEVGFRIAWTNEIDQNFADMYEHAMTVLRVARGNNREPARISCRESIEKLTSDKILKGAFGRTKPPIFGIIGGPPCPDFSAGGKNRGSSGKNGRLTKTFLDAVCKIRPHFFLMENVPGLYRTKKHRGFFNRSINSVRENGYIVDFKIINALELGVPQDRQRLFVIGFLKNLLSPQKRKELSLCNKDWYRWPEDPNFRNAKCLPWPDRNEFGKDVKLPKNIPIELTVYPLLCEDSNPEALPNGKEVFHPYSSKFWERDEGDVTAKSFKRLHRYRYSPTAWYGNNEVHLHPWKPRRLSVREALRIQTVPDEYVLPEKNSLQSKFKMICNGVPCKMSKCLANSIADFLRSSCDILHPQNRFFVSWYKKYGRDFPWRESGTSPFEILVTEMLLRQTKADMVSRMWKMFTTLYPDPEAIVKTSKNDLEDVIKELGFGNQRSHALKEAAQYLLDNFRGEVPDSEEELLKIPHVGIYTARATLCFAFGQKRSIVDLNVIRFFGRYYGLDLKPDNRREPFVWDRAREILPYRKADAKLHNYGLLDFNGLVCRPVRPDCINCMLRFSCANMSGTGR